MSKKKMIAVDADYLIHQIVHSFDAGTRQFSEYDSNIDGTYKQPIKPMIERFEDMVEDLIDDIAVVFLGEFKIKGAIPFFTSHDNFRHRLTDTYKANRASRSDLHMRFVKKLKKHYPDSFIPNTEADDVVAYYVAQKGYIGATFDKDLLLGVPGVWFDVYHARRSIVRTSQIEARNFTLLQSVMGDLTDGIQGIAGVGEKTAIKLLDKYGWDWGGVVASYIQYGMTERDAILTRRLIGMDQWTPESGVQLFTSY